MDRPYLVGLLVAFILVCWTVIGSSLYAKYQNWKFNRSGHVTK